MAYCSQKALELPAMSPVLPCFRSWVSVAFQISKRTFMGIPVPGQAPVEELKIFIKYAENSYEAFSHKPEMGVW